ncbi:MAG: hypothetical protein PHX83_06600 [Acidobacteriia bacterium]|nr:hypothetical protein [Terriglobia bacterium]
MTPKRIKEIRAALDSGYDKVQVATVDASELRDLLSTADEAARLRAENAKLRREVEPLRVARAMDKACRVLLRKGRVR